jgi:DNA-binding winged helix-turn-helix (wHTH) protein
MVSEELRSVVSGPGTYVDFEQRLNHCIKEVRAALADQAVAPLYIETLPRGGCRCIGRISTEADENVAPDGEEATWQRRA